MLTGPNQKLFPYIGSVMRLQLWAKLAHFQKTKHFIFVIKIPVSLKHPRPDSSRITANVTLTFSHKPLKFVRRCLGKVCKGLSDTQGCETHQLWTRCWRRCWSRGCRRPSARPRRCRCRSPWTLDLWCPGWWSRGRCRGRSGWWPYALSSVRRGRFSASWRSAPPAASPPPGAARGCLN